MPKKNWNTRVRDLIEGLNGQKGQTLVYAESVCTVKRLQEVCNHEFNTIPIVNTYGLVIGMIPKHFIITLLAHKKFYEFNYLTKRKTTVADAFKSYRERQNSQMSDPMSPGNQSQDKIKLRINPSNHHSGEFSKDYKDDGSDNNSDELDYDKVQKKDQPGSDQASEPNELAPPAPPANVLMQSMNSRRNKVKETINKYTGDADRVDIPFTKEPLSWEHFNVDFWSSQRKWSEVAEIADQNPEQLIDLRPYMIEAPFKVHSTDRLPKVLDYFRMFHLRALPVIDPNDGRPVAILTRQDLFAYMSL